MAQLLKLIVNLVGNRAANINFVIGIGAGTLGTNSSASHSAPLVTVQATLTTSNAGTLPYIGKCLLVYVCVSINEGLMTEYL